MTWRPALLALAGAALAPAQAAALKCVYTEPFVTTAFDPRAGSVVITRAGEPGATSFRVAATRSRGKIELVNRSRAFRQTATKDGKGSDGMSDTVFPYSATLTWKGLPYPLHGGCR